MTSTWMRCLWAASLLVPLSAMAQMRGGGLGGPLPVGLDLSKASSGAWAEYTQERGEGPPRKVRIALVGREQGAAVIEYSSDLGEGRGLAITRMVLDVDPTKEGGVKKLIMQRGDADPMDVPSTGGQGSGDSRGPRAPHFLKPDAKKLLGKETLKLAAGSFKVDHYRDETPGGGTVDYWLCSDVPPFGLVKLETTLPAGSPSDRGPRGPRKLELVAKGKDAKPLITKQAKPFDAEAMRAMWGRRGDGAGGPPPEAAPAGPAGAGSAAPK